MEIKDNSLVYVVIKNVSKSGMTRKIDFYIKVKETDYLQNINQELNEVLDWGIDKNGHLIVKGCGMDMVWYALNQYTEHSKVSNLKYQLL